MDLRVLGPVEVWHGGTQLYLARRQQRLIVGILALEANRWVPCDRLIDLLWDDAPPRNARAIVQTRLSELRGVLSTLPGCGDEWRLATHGGGYSLQVDPSQVDAYRFRSIVDECRGGPDPETKRKALREALALWRGPVFGDALPAEAYEALSHGLESARLSAAEDLYEVELQLGEHDRVVDEILHLSAEHPTRERLVGQMMLALYRCGRCAEALQRYDRWRRWLGDQLGVDPSGQIQQLHRAILLGDTERLTLGPGDPGRAEAAEPEEPVASEHPPGFTAAVPRILPPDIPDFTGRAREVALLREVLTRRGHEGVRMVAVGGPGGIGKTALCVHVAHALRDEYPDGQLYANLRGADEQGPADPYEVLGRFLRALGVDGNALPDTVDGRVDLYRDLLSDRRVILVLDNAGSDDQLLPLIPGGPASAVIINARPRLGAAVGAHPISLDQLDPPQATVLLGQILGEDRVAAEPAAVAELCGYCGHLPLALRVVGARLVTKPHWRIEKLVNLLRCEHGRLDQLAHGHLDVRAGIALSYAGLAPEVRTLLRRLGDLDLPEIAVWQAAALLDTDTITGEDRLEQLFDAQLLDFVGAEATGQPRYRLHDLVRLFAKERAELDEPVAALDQARERVLGAWLCIADASYRKLFGGPYQNIVGDAPRWAIDQRLVQSLVADPLRWFETERHAIVATVRRAGVDGRVTGCWELASTTSDLFQMRRYHDDWQQMLGAALAATRWAGDRRGEAVILYRMGIASGNRLRYREAWNLFQDAGRLFEEVGDRHGQAITMFCTAMVERMQGDDVTALAGYEQALIVLREQGDHGGVAFVIRSIGQIHLERGAYPMAEDCFEQSLALARRVGWRQGTPSVLLWRGTLRLRQERYAEAEADLRTALGLVRALGDRTGEGACLRVLGQCKAGRGQREQARAILREALHIMRQPTPTIIELLIRDSLAALDAEDRPAPPVLGGAGGRGPATLG